MQIHLSLNFDSSPLLDISSKEALLGVVASGPLNFLGTIESMLGLKGSSPAAFERRVLYAEAMKMVTGEPFFLKSFAVDSTGASAQLLKIRDELLLSAPYTFSLKDIKTNSKRIAELAAIESHFITLDPPAGIPDMLRTVITELSKPYYTLPPTQIIIYEDISLWPSLWQQLFNALKVKGFTIENAPKLKNRADKKSDLGIALSILEMNDTDFANAIADKREAKGDASLIQIKTLTLSEAGDITAAVIKKAKEDFGDSVALIAKDWNDYLDEALSRSTLSQTGHSSSKSTSESAAYLSQYLSLFWQPSHPSDFQAWLLNSLNPLLRYTADRAAEALAGTPSISGLKWEEILEGADEKTPEKKRAWVDPIFAGTPPENGGHIADICKKVADWANKQSFGYKDRDNDRSAEYMSCSHFAKTAASFFTRLQKSKFTKNEALKIISEIVLASAGNCDVSSEINSVRIAGSANALAAQCDCVIYWASNRSSISNEPDRFWNKDEEKELIKNGISFIPAETRILAAADEWRRAALSAGQRLIIVTNEISAGEPDGVHPIWHELSIPFKNNSLLEISSADIENYNSTDKETKHIIKSICDTKSLKKHTLADINTESESWQIRSSIEQIKEESATSLGSLISCPFHWSLKRAAFINSSAKYSSAKDVSITGTLCHEVIEKFLNKYNDPSLCPDIEKEISSTFDKTCPLVYEKLLLPEEQVTKEGLRLQVLRAGTSLCKILIASNLKLDSSEYDFNFKLDYGDAHGKPDIVMVRKDNPSLKVIIDLKLGGKDEKYALLKKGRAVQLSQYSKLVQKISKLKEIPPVAYFIISNSVMLADASYADIFIGANLIKCDQNAEEQWNDICNFTKLNLSNLKNGLVQIGIPVSRLDNRSLSKQYAAPCKYCDYNSFCSRSAKKGQE